MTQSQLKEFLTFCINNKMPVLVTGAPGIGKTDLIKEGADDSNADLIISHPVVSDPTDYKGLPFKKQGIDEATFLPFGELSKILNATKLTAFFLDDLGQATPAVQAACMQLILERKINGFKVSDHVTFIAATNRRADKAGVSGILEPVKSRFASIVELTVETNDWCKWAITKGNMPIELIAFIRFRPELLHKFEPTKEIVNTPSPRTVANLGKLQKSGIPSHLQFEAFTGAAGEGFASEYTAFLDMYKLLPSIDKILLHPKTVEVPTEPSMLYAISSALGYKINENNADNAFQYIDRIPKEFQIITVKDAMIKNPDVDKTEAYTKWAIQNGNEILN